MNNVITNTTPSNTQKMYDYMNGYMADAINPSALIIVGIVVIAYIVVLYI